jgi:hypothetical protein
MTPDSPSDKSGRPASGGFLRYWRVWKWLVMAGALGIAGAAIILPKMIRVRGGPGHEYVRSISNLRQIGIALAEFEDEFGSLPSDVTIPLVQKRYPNIPLPLGTSSSNDYFRQLIVAEISQDKAMFYGYVNSPHKPPHSKDLTTALLPGECGFAYIISGPNVSRPDTPLAAYPLVKGKLVFDTTLAKLWGDKAVVLYSDCSVRGHPIDSSGRMMINGRDLFDSSQPHWNGKSPIVKWQE